MKKKYYGLLAVSMAAASVFVSFAYAMLAPRGNPAEVFRLVNTQNTSVPGPAVVREFMRLERTLKDISDMSKSDPAPVDLSLFGYNVSSSSDEALMEKMSLGSDLSEQIPISFTYALSLTFLAGDNRFCILDGSFYDEGDLLPDSGSIKKIETNKVLIEKQGIEKWVFLAPALSTEKNEATQK